MHPGFMHWWKEAQRQQHGGGGCEAGAGCGPGFGPGSHPGAERLRQARDRWAAAGHGGEEGGGFGVRRPLRFMAWKLELDDEQIEALAAILADLKTERAQAAVDERRSVAAFADAGAGEAFDKEAATRAAQTRVATAEKLRDAVVAALEKTHALLKPEQRKALAYLLRSGQLTI
jgi:Spy/CpxP family protein refolding chaperone